MNREFDVGVKRRMTDYFSGTPMYDDKKNYPPLSHASGRL
jgi:hypothetical protein